MIDSEVTGPLNVTNRRKCCAEFIENNEEFRSGTVFGFFNLKVLMLAVVGLAVTDTINSSFAANPNAGGAPVTRPENGDETDVETGGVTQEATSNTKLVSAGETWSEQGWPFLQRFCGDCHNADSREGELDLSGFESLDAIAKESSSLQRVVEMVKFGAMPPEDSEQPEEAVRRHFGELADSILYSVTCDLRPRPGKVTARRLNRAEYNNSVRDLLGIDFDPADDFPSDEVGAGFDNNGDVLSLSTLLMEKYLDAAEEIASRVIIDPDTLQKIRKDVASDQIYVAGQTQVGRFNGRFFREDGFAWIPLEIPYTGHYRFSFSGGNASPDRGKTKIGIFNEDGQLVASGEVGYYGGSGSSDTFRFELDLKQGARTLYFAPLASEQQSDDANGKADEPSVEASLSSGNESTAEVKESPKSAEPVFSVSDRVNQAVIEAATAAIATPLKPDRRVDENEFPHMIRTIRIDGPDSFPRDAYPESHHRVIKRVASRSRGRWDRVEEAARESLRPVMRHAFRRDVTDDEVGRYAALVKRCTDRGMSYFEGMQSALAAVLVSPNFLFRIESPSGDEVIDSEGTVALNPAQLMTRLSYFLWSSLPDERLLNLGSAEELSEKQLVAEVQRMIIDPRSKSLAEQFAAQWFGLRNLDRHDADLDQFPGFTPELRRAMQEETKRLFMHLLAENRPIGELLSANYTFVNPLLASHYGMTGVEGDDFVKVSLEGTGRRGLLTHASVLTLTSYPRRTSPVQRGKWVLENVFGTPPPDPPAGVPTLEEAEVATDGLSLREQMELHRRDPACASCHRVMDQLGFGLEEFDAVGARQVALGGADVAKIDSSGELPGGRAFTGAAELSQILSLTEARAFAKTAVERLLTFALGRELRPQDRCVVDEIIEKTENQQFRLQDLVREVVLSRPFCFYEWETAGSVAVLQDSDQSNE